MTPTILQFQNVDFQWADATKPLIQNFTWSLEPGEAFYLDAPSGQGKSTFLKLATGLLKPTRGKILRDTKQIGFAFQDQRLLPWLTPYENLKLAMRHPDDEQIHKLLARVGLTQKAEQHTSTLSGGEAQRINIARALLNNPLLLVLDEPFNGLDEENAQICAELIQEWKNHSPENTLILTTHLHKFQTLCNAKKLVFS